MISGRNIICLASGWDYHPTSKHHVMRRLAAQNNVVWVNWHASRRPHFGLSDLRTIGARIWQIRQGPKRVSDAITALTPWQLPIPGSNRVCRWNAASVRRAISAVLRDLPPRPVQIWSFAPDAAQLIGSFNEERVVYYCVDAFAEFPGYDRDLIAARERELLAKSDVVITTSVPLYEAKRQMHPNVHLVCHGVDYERLSRAVTEPMPMPQELVGLSRPILGYVGVVGRWVDMHLLRALAERRPRASIVMIGPEITPRGPAAGVRNIHWLGERDHTRLAQYLGHFDVGLIPFQHVPLTHHANPIKLNEYLAAGVPVVSTYLPAVEPVPGSVWLADDAAELAHCCDQACQLNDTANRKRRAESMASESWDARIEEISGIVSAAVRPASVTAAAAPAGAAPRWAVAHPA